MAYVAVSGGEAAIEASIRLLEWYRGGTPLDLELEAIEKKLGLLLDRVMGEAGLYAPAYAALAIRQSEGSVEEAVFLLRAYRSTLTRHYYTTPVDTAAMRAVRRISAAFEEIPGGQMLGATYDYTHRLIQFEPSAESAPDFYARMQAWLAAQTPEPVQASPHVSDALKREGLLNDPPACDDPPFDVTENLLEYPAPRSARLQTLARADTGFLSGLAYSALRGFGLAHPTVGELRTGYVALCVPYLFDPNQSVYVGEILLTEVECLTEADDTGKLNLALGYGAVFGRNENKAIAMAVVDEELNQRGPYPAQDEEFVLTHGDSLEMNGFLSHLKLPHYVTFQSKLDAVRKTRGNADEPQL